MGQVNHTYGLTSLADSGISTSSSQNTPFRPQLFVCGLLFIIAIAVGMVCYRRYERREEIRLRVARGITAKCEEKSEPQMLDIYIKPVNASERNCSEYAHLIPFEKLEKPRIWNDIKVRISFTKHLNGMLIK